MNTFIKTLITLLLALTPMSSYNLINSASGADRVAQNDTKAGESEEAEGDDEGEDESDDGEEYAEDGAAKPSEGQATNGQEEKKPEELAQPASPPTEEKALPKPSDISPPIEPEIANTPPPPAPPRLGLKAKKIANPSPKAKPKKEIAKAKKPTPKSKPKKEIAKAKKQSPKSKPKETAKKSTPKKNGKGKGDKKPAGKMSGGSRTVTANCNMREKPTQKSKKLGLLNSGQKIKAEPKSGDWFKITNKGKTAFVNAACFK